MVAGELQGREHDALDVLAPACVVLPVVIHLPRPLVKEDVVLGVDISLVRLPGLDGLVELRLEVRPGVVSGVRIGNRLITPVASVSKLGVLVAELLDALELAGDAVLVHVGIQTENQPRAGSALGRVGVDGAEDGDGGEAVGVAMEGDDDVRDARCGGRGQGQDVALGDRNLGACRELGLDLRCHLRLHPVGEAVLGEEDNRVLVPLRVEVRAGHDVVPAAEGVDGIGRVNEGRPDLLEADDVSGAVPLQDPEGVRDLRRAKRVAK